MLTIFTFCVREMWYLIELNERGLSVNSTIKFGNRIQINWNRIMHQDYRFQEKPSFENLHNMWTEQKVEKVAKKLK